MGLESSRNKETGTICLLFGRLAMLSPRVGFHLGTLFCSNTPALQYSVNSYTIFIALPEEVVNHF